VALNVWELWVGAATGVQCGFKAKHQASPAYCSSRPFFVTFVRFPSGPTHTNPRPNANGRFASSDFFRSHAEKLQGESTRCSAIQWSLTDPSFATSAGRLMKVVTSTAMNPATDVIAVPIQRIRYAPSLVALSAQARRLLDTLVRSDVCLRGPGTLNRSIRLAYVVSVRRGAQKLLVDERIEHQLTKRLLDAAQPFNLFAFQPQTRHFQILGTHRRVFSAVCAT
jgi:hypothetical protein